MPNRTVELEIITPREMFYRGQVEMLSVTTTEGQEGFMANHAWCIKLLKEEGKLKIREAGSNVLKEAWVKGGHVDIKEHFVVYVDEAEWVQD